MDLTYYLKKKVYIELKSGRVYSGIVLEVSNGTLYSTLTIRDKYGYRIIISISEVEIIEEEKTESYTSNRSKRWKKM